MLVAVPFAAGVRAADTLRLGEFIPVASPQPAPAASFKTDAGRPATFGDFRGRPTVVNLWATWCGPCLREMPSLVKLQAAFAGRLAVAAISEDHRGAAVVDPFVATRHLTSLQIYLDPKQRVAEAFGVNELPTSIVLDTAGRVVGRVVGGADWTSPKMLAVLRPLMKNPGDEPALTRAAR
jgi:thiol-disulfide isomerase/thioredoxin